MGKFLKTGCIGLLAGTALSMIMGVQGAKADQIDDEVNKCIRVSQSRPLTDEEAEYCNLAVKYQQDRELRKLQLELLRQNQEMIQKLYETPAIVPTDFGFGNNTTENP
ncbi:MAG: hypothetical protein RMX96_22465 [Nostoc sp. ChiSLP02]|nr:hypothetical protein [Nostoc sp. DedSLP05]MDZ8099286.1 hypothetical protein [Nostoc sp. DedSLP01]MDZ8187601.1 hypothetical protein [Nostoc sp. ChiSLP02]